MLLFQQFLHACSFGAIHIYSGKKFQHTISIFGLPILLFEEKGDGFMKNLLRNSKLDY